MGREETVHFRINRRRRSQIWHQWYDGCALSTVKSTLKAFVNLFSFEILSLHLNTAVECYSKVCCKLFWGP